MPVVTFLFNLMCAIVSCDPYYHPPAAKPYNVSYDSNLLGAYRASRNIDIFPNPSHPEDWKPDPLVSTKAGIVEGYFMKVLNGRMVYAFEGIPYAESTAGNRRFRAPVPKSSWRGVRMVKKPGHLCTQLHAIKLNRVVGHEDCLTVNVYTPMISVGSYKPKMGVLVFLHGGGYFFGGGSEYGPALLLQKDVILVTVNYRLGPLGFLSTGDEESPGNYGLKDQALAIKWVSENIERFGGDSTKITLSGHSAGAGSVHLQMMSNQSNHLFQRAISMSGSAFANWAIHTPHQARKWAEKLARFMRCPTSSSAEMMNCFRQRNPNFITANLWNLWDVIGFPPVSIRPVIEPDIPGAFLTKSPEEAYEQNEVAKIPFIATNTKDEAELFRIILKGLGFFRLWLRNWEVLAPTMLDYRHVAGDNSSAVTKALSDFYFPGQDILKVPGRELSKVGTDRYFNIGNRKALKYHSKIAPTYSYIFTLPNPKGLANLFGYSADDYGVSHGDDLAFIFNSSLYFEAFNERDSGIEVVNLMVNLFSNFISKGTPYYTGDDGKDYEIWEPVKDPENPMFLEIAQEVKMISDPVKARVEFWNTLHLNESYPYDYA